MEYMGSNIEKFINLYNCVLAIHKTGKQSKSKSTLVIIFLVRIYLVLKDYK